MLLLHEVRKRARHIAGPVLGASIFLYFAYHAIQGDRGIIAWLWLSQQVEEAAVTATTISSERIVLERRTDALGPGKLDLDLLDERVRLTLGYAHPDDIVIFKKTP